MSFIRTKTVNGNLYFYRVKSIRQGKKVIQKNLEYLGSAHTVLRQDLSQEESTYIQGILDQLDIVDLEAERQAKKLLKNTKSNANLKNVFENELLNHGFIQSIKKSHIFYKFGDEKTFFVNLNNYTVFKKEQERFSNASLSFNKGSLNTKTLRKLFGYEKIAGLGHIDRSITRIIANKLLNDNFKQSRNNDFLYYKKAGNKLLFVNLKKGTIYGRENNKIKQEKIKLNNKQIDSAVLKYALGIKKGKRHEDVVSFIGKTFLKRVLRKTLSRIIGYENYKAILILKQAIQRAKKQKEGNKFRQALDNEKQKNLAQIQNLKEQKRKQKLQQKLEKDYLKQVRKIESQRAKFYKWQEKERKRFERKLQTLERKEITYIDKKIRQRKKLSQKEINLRNEKRNVSNYIKNNLNKKTNLNHLELIQLYMLPKKYGLSYQDLDIQSRIDSTLSYEENKTLIKHYLTKVNQKNVQEIEDFGSLLQDDDKLLDKAFHYLELFRAGNIDAKNELQNLIPKIKNDNVREEFEQFF